MNFTRIFLRIACLITLLASLHAAHASELIDSRVRLSAQVGQANVEAFQGSSQKISIFGIFGSKKSTATVPGLAEISTLSMSGCSRVSGTNIQSAASVGTQNIKGSTLRLASVTLSC